MKAVAYLFAMLLIGLGVVFLAAAAHTGLWTRCVLGGVLLGAGLSVLYILRMKTPETRITVTHQVDLSGDVSLERLLCTNCGATLDAKSTSVRAGAVFVRCPYCESEFQVEEAPKW
ncbi:MAG: hypothetical protein IT364_11035 [Candidatus Hydrogenedentes bacterium]|nr:hypothetical protein [Candidatus Hydrogenedentota bacterium]